MIDHYQTLGLTPQASQGEIKAAYRKLAKKYHPDAVADRPELAGKMYEIQAAYEVLGDEVKKRNYDIELDKSKSPGRKNQPGSRSSGSGAENPFPGSNMSAFESFFSFQPGKGMETYHGQGKNPNKQKPGGPIDVDQLFAEYFGGKK